MGSDGSTDTPTPPAYLFDAYPHPRTSHIIVWVKHGNRVSKRKVAYNPTMCIKAESEPLEVAERILSKDDRVEIFWRDTSRLWLRGPEEPVLRIRPKRFQDMHRIATDLRRATKSKGYTFYDVDNQAESRWMHEQGLWPMCRLAIEDGHPLLEPADDEERFTHEYDTPDLRTVHLRVIVDAEGTCRDVDGFSDDLLAIQIHDQLIEVGTIGEPAAEQQAFLELRRLLTELDPDIIFTQHGDRFDIPYLLSRIRQYEMHESIWLGREPDPVVGDPDQKGKSIHTYGRWLYKTDAYYLKGRWHIDLSKKTLDSESDRKDIHGILYLCRVSNRRGQDVNRNGAGYALQQMQIDSAQDMGVAIPWKRNLVEDWKDAATLCAVDRGGQIMVPTPGIYGDVAACDFSGYYPSLIVEHNLSSDSINCNCCPNGPLVPELGYHLCEKQRGHQAGVLERLNPHRRWAKSVLKRAKHEPIYDPKHRDVNWPAPVPPPPYDTNTSCDLYVSGDTGTPLFGQGQRTHVADPSGNRQHPARRAAGRPLEPGGNRPPDASETGSSLDGASVRRLPEAAGIRIGRKQGDTVDLQPQLRGTTARFSSSFGPAVNGQSGPSPCFGTQESATFGPVSSCKTKISGSQIEHGCNGGNTDTATQNPEAIDKYVAREESLAPSTTRQLAGTLHNPDERTKPDIGSDNLDRHPQGIRPADGLPDVLTHDLIAKAQAIRSEHKALGVVCFGYFRYRNARFGCAEIHQAIQCYGRAGMTEARRVINADGGDLVHAMTDCTFIQKPGIDRPAALRIARKISNATGVQMDLEGMYKWVVFLPSKVHSHSEPGAVGVPNRYYGKFIDDSMKFRGIEVQRHSTPDWIHDIQQRMLSVLERADTPDEFRSLIPAALRVAQIEANRLRRREVDPRTLGTMVQATREVEDYTAATNTRSALVRLRDAGTERKPGEYVKYVVARHDGPKESRVIPVELFDAASPWFGELGITYHAMHYLRLLARSVETILAPFGYWEEAVFEWLIGKRERPEAVAPRRVDVPARPVWVRN